MSAATNGIGWHVETYCNWTGWRRASKVHATVELANAEMAAWPVKGVELRVYESLAEAA